MKTWNVDDRYILCKDEDGKFGVVPKKLWIRCMNQFKEYE